MGNTDFGIDYFDQYRSFARTADLDLLFRSFQANFIICLFILRASDFQMGDLPNRTIDSF